MDAAAARRLSREVAALREGRQGADPARWANRLAVRHGIEPLFTVSTTPSGAAPALVYEHTPGRSVTFSEWAWDTPQDAEETLTSFAAAWRGGGLGHEDLGAPHVERPRRLADRDRDAMVALLAEAAALAAGDPNSDPARFANRLAGRYGIEPRFVLHATADDPGRPRLAYALGGRRAISFDDWAFADAAAADRVLGDFAQALRAGQLR